MIPTMTAAVVGIAALCIIIALIWRATKLTRTLEDAKAVNRVLSGNWRDIPIYVSPRTSELLCSAFNCPTSGHILWPTQRLTMHQVVTGFTAHHRQYHLGDQR